ncbi:hypothetical protein [Desulfomonile tiedjei]|uniref:Uncharacterized protein n=1 Tax=Desulfomonile tiedjei (strain ATCC 49306 / DSM 6799 / DCB-1) TaxID=706587 RepID=I4CBA8_DESTA|nr:hypothetical protein [Desulfomonile tiedjei]AFM26849.1 hypothetical protein Desti_4212 [Desulfomonile tiedjei DSM 6799]
MSDTETRERDVESTVTGASDIKVPEDECASIKDPVRRSLCRVCNAPVLGKAPFCSTHEPPVP